MESHINHIEQFRAERSQEELHDLLSQKSWRDPASRFGESIRRNRAAKWIVSLIPVAIIGAGLYTLASADSEVEGKTTEEITTTTTLSSGTQECIDRAVRTYEMSSDQDTTKLLAEREACIQNELLTGGLGN